MTITLRSEEDMMLARFRGKLAEHILSRVTNFTIPGTARNKNKKILRVTGDMVMHIPPDDPDNDISLFFWKNSYLVVE